MALQTRHAPRVLAGAGAIVVLVALLAGSPLAAAGPAQVTFWLPVDLGGGLANVMQVLVAEFNQTHPRSM